MSNDQWIQEMQAAQVQLDQSLLRINQRANVQIEDCKALFSKPIILKKRPLLVRFIRHYRVYRNHFGPLRSIVFAWSLARV